MEGYNALSGGRSFVRYPEPPSDRMPNRAGFRRERSRLPRTRKIITSIVLSLVLLALGVFVAGWFIATKPTAARTDLRAAVPLVEVLTLRPANIRHEFAGWGTARAERDVLLSAEVSCEIVEIVNNIRDGSAVRAGESLIRLDDREYRSQLARAEALAAELLAQTDGLAVEEANLSKLIAIAERELEVNAAEDTRVSNLFEQGQASQREFNFARLALDRSRRELQALQSQLDQIAPRRAALGASRAVRLAEADMARLSVERCDVRAPFDGRIENLMVREGHRVLPGSPLLRLIDPRHVEVPIALPASAHAELRPDALCRLSCDAAPQLNWSGRIARIAPRADERSRTLPVFVEVDNAEQSAPLLPGNFVRATIDGPLLRAVLAVPRGALLGDRLYVVNDGQAHQRTVQIERIVGEQAVLSGEIAPGDRVILTNFDVLYEGAPVRISGADDPAAESPQVASGTAAPPAAEKSP